LIRFPPMETDLINISDKARSIWETSYKIYYLRLNIIYYSIQITFQPYSPLPRRSNKKNNLKEQGEKSYL